MKRALLLALLGLTGFLCHPSKTLAQCRYECISILDVEGRHVTFGCAWYSDMLTRCAPSKTVCIMEYCSAAFVTDANGAVLAEADICRDKVTLRPVTRPEKKVASRTDRRGPPKRESSIE